MIPVIYLASSFKLIKKKKLIDFFFKKLSFNINLI